MGERSNSRDDIRAQLRKVLADHALARVVSGSSRKRRGP